MSGGGGKKNKFNLLNKLKQNPPRKSITSQIQNKSKLMEEKLYATMAITTTHIRMYIYTRHNFIRKSVKKCVTRK